MKREKSELSVPAAAAAGAAVVAAVALAAGALAGRPQLGMGFAAGLLAGAANPYLAGLSLRAGAGEFRMLALLRLLVVTAIVGLVAVTAGIPAAIAAAAGAACAQLLSSAVAMRRALAR